MGPEAQEGHGHVFIACKNEGWQHRDTIHTLHRLGCTDLFRVGMDDAQRAERLQEFILNLRMDADQVARLFCEAGIDCMALNSMSRLRISNPSPIRAFKFGGDHRGKASTGTYHFTKIDPHPIGGSVEKFSPCSLLGGSLKTPAEHAHLGTVDVVSGFSGCLSTCLALFKRLRSGVCDVARTSLASNAQLIQTPFMFDYAGKDPDGAVEAAEPRGPHAVGEHWLYR